MKKAVGIILASLFILVFGFFLIAEWWVESIFNEVMNQKPDRVYDVSYEDLDLHTFLKGVTLESAEITPINASDTATVLHGKVRHIELSGIQWRHFFLSKKANVREMVFIEPDFQISMPHTTEHKEKKDRSNRGMQNLFGDILSRGEIHNFKLIGGSAEARMDTLLIARVTNLTIEATEIVTDSLQAKSIIPFKVGSLDASLDSAYLQLNDYTELRSGYYAYHTENSQLELNNISMAFTKDRLQVSNLIGEQVDLIEVKMKSLRIDELDAQSNFSELDIRAKSMLIDGFELKDFRDKNKPRPPDAEKPMFSAMVKSVPISLKVDSIQVRNSHIYYSELGENKSEAGTIHFADVSVDIAGLTTIPEYQESTQSFNVKINAKLNQQAGMAVNMDVPYNSESFKMHATIGSFNLGVLNTTLRPLAGVEVTSGIIHKIDIQMDANRTGSHNVLVVDYDSLGLAVLKDEGHDFKKKGLISTIANGAIRHTNMPEHNHYQVADYQSYRNIYRGPFNFMWETAKEGMMFIVPTGATSILLGDIEKKARKKQEKQEKDKKKPENLKPVAQSQCQTKAKYPVFLSWQSLLLHLYHHYLVKRSEGQTQVTRQANPV